MRRLTATGRTRADALHGLATLCRDLNRDPDPTTIDVTEIREAHRVAHYVLTVDTYPPELEDRP